MIAQPRYIAIYKDSETAKNLYFGPLMSINVAEQFLSGLPEPRLGGYKTYKPISPYMHDETREIAAVIIHARARVQAAQDVKQIAHHMVHN